LKLKDQRLLGPGQVLASMVPASGPAYRRWRCTVVGNRRILRREIPGGISSAARQCQGREACASAVHAAFLIAGYALCIGGTGFF
jgi:hypothetical protein